MQVDWRFSTGLCQQNIVCSVVVPALTGLAMTFVSELLGGRGSVEAFNQNLDKFGWFHQPLHGGSVILSLSSWLSGKSSA